ncbi:hypothetical protein KH5_17250 [Urechidicola sp. KH5]
MKPHILVCCIFLFSLCSIAQEVNIQHIQENVGIGTAGITNRPITLTADRSKAFALPINNRKTHAGRSDSYDASNLHGDDMAGARVITADNTLTYYREPLSDPNNMSFQTSIWEYTGAPGGYNEFIVRGRYAVTIGSADATNDKNIDLSGAGIVDPNKCIPFITGFLNDDTTNGAANATAIAYLDSPTNMIVSRGGEFSTSEVTVYITLVEFTGDNWVVLHGRNLTDTEQNSGNIVLYDGYDGTSFTGVPYSVFDWDNAIIFSQSFSANHVANNNKHNTRSIWPLFTPNTGDQSVDWQYPDTKTAGNNKVRHFVHVLDNPQVNITRYDNDDYPDNGSNINIAPSVTSLSESLIIGSTISDGLKQYGMGWRNYYFNSTNQVGHWSHRAGADPGVPIATHLQIIDFSNLSNTPVQREAPGGLTADLLLWLKGDKGVEESDGSTPEDGEDVEIWRGNTSDDNYTDILASKPVYSESSFNFNPTVSFNGTNVGFTMQNTIDGNSEMTIFAVAEGTYPSSGQKHLINLQRDSNRYLSAEMITSSRIRGRYSRGGGSTSKHDITSSSITQNEPFLLGFEHTASSTNELYNKGISLGTTAAGTDVLSSHNLQIGIGRMPTRTDRNWAGQIAELIVFDKKVDADERNKIESYLAIKYGMTLGSEGVSQNYVDSDNRTIWDASEDSGDFNYKVTGIGRDDKSSLNQKQSKNIVASAIDEDITIGIKEISNSNAENSNFFFSNKTFMIWGNDNGLLSRDNTDLTKDFSLGIGDAMLNTNLTAKRIERKWKLVVTDSVPTVKLSIPESMVSLANPDNDDYIMIVSDDAAFTTNVTSATMDLVGANLEVDYYFEGTKYITFGSAPQVDLGDRSAYFDNSGTTDAYLDAGNVNDLNGTSFTISAWVKRNIGQDKFDVVSKRNYYDESSTNLGGFSYGYAFRINQNGQFRMVWKNHGESENNQLETFEQIPENEWHHIAASYDISGGSMGKGITRLYIDGIEMDSDDTLEPMNIPNNAHFMIGAAHHIKRQQKVRGSIDEVRVWRTALSGEQIRYVMNQEIEENASNFAAGIILPSTTTKNEIAAIPWGDLIAYYPMKTAIFGSIKDESNSRNDATMINFDQLDYQTAPLPYKSSATGGDWDDPNSWENGDVQYLPGVVSYLFESEADADKETMDYNIVQIDNNITLNNSNTSLIPSYKQGNRTVLGLIVNSGGDLEIEGDNSLNTGYGLTVSHYLKVDGTIDLEGESQLVQTAGSDLDPTSNGTLEKDQQGTTNTYIYNYWSSPVGLPNNSTNNNSFTVTDVFQNVGFLPYGFNGTPSPLMNADYWIWKYTNNANNAYSAWQHVRSSGSIDVGQGFTMKGPGSAGVLQNYVFRGKPNNGDFTLPLGANSGYLVGNPYPSAIDADEFIKDNISSGETDGNNATGNVINGALYFWHHFAINSHYLAEYEGGYAVYTLMGGVQAINNDVRINATGAGGGITPLRYIPVGQGFFVSSALDLALDGAANDPDLNLSVDGGNIVFENDQRIFQKESALHSLFFRPERGNSNTNDRNRNPDNSEENASSTSSRIDTRQKIRIKFDSADGYHRQLLVGVDENATDNFDIGYDAILNESNDEDMYWQYKNVGMVIQGVNNFNEDQILPLTIKTNIEGLVGIKIDSLENIADDIDIYLYDELLNTIYDLRAVESQEVYLLSGLHKDRFAIVFSEQMGILNTDDVALSQLELFYSNESQKLVINNPNAFNLENVQIFNVLGQSVSSFEIDTQSQLFEKINPIDKTGIYIVRLKTELGDITKKILVQ